MMRLLPVLTAMLLVAAYGIAEGVWTNRWSSADATERAAARLADVPRTVGAWEGTDAPLDPRQVVQAELVGYTMRRYVHRETGASVSVLLVCGRPGPISAHTPEMCYPGAGFAAVAPPERQDVT